MPARSLWAAAAAIALIVSVSQRADAILVTWSWSGVASVQNSNVFPNGSLYTARLTFDADTPTVGNSSSGWMYESAIVGISFDAPGYHAGFSRTPSSSSSIAATATYLDFYAAAGGYSPASPGFEIRLSDVYLPDPSHLPIQPPTGFGANGYINLYLDYYSALATASFPVTSIQVSVPEPGAAFLSGLLVVGLSSRRCSVRRRSIRKGGETWTPLASARAASPAQESAPRSERTGSARRS